MTTIGITADFHFDTYRSVGLSTGQVTSRLPELTQCFRWIIRCLHKRGIKDLFILGDLVHNRCAVEVPVLHAIGECLEYARESDVRVVVVAGNHDSYLRNSRVSSLTPMGCRVVTAPMLMEMNSNATELLHLIPWADSAKELRRAIASLPIRSVKTKERQRRYLFGHFMLNGLFPGQGGINQEDLHESDYDRIILGHVHDGRKVSAKTRYVGAPLALDYGDCAGDRGFILLDLKTDRLVRIVNKRSPKFHQVDSVEAAAQVRSGDYVRVRAVSQETRDRIVECLKASNPDAKVETELVEADFGGKARLDLTEGSGAVGKYCDYVGLAGEERERLVQLGNRILETAAAGKKP